MQPDAPKVYDHLPDNRNATLTPEPEALAAADAVFARADGTVSSVIHDTRPLSLTSQSSVEPVNYVLELNAGTARRLNIGRKSRITWEAAND